MFAPMSFDVGGVMDRKYYQDRADECLLAVQDLRDPEARLGLLAIAQRYILLAIHLGLWLDSGTPHTAPEKPARQDIENDGSASV
jgi:hypothetical protein